MLDLSLFMAVVILSSVGIWAGAGTVRMLIAELRNHRATCYKTAWAYCHMWYTSASILPHPGTISRHLGISKKVAAQARDAYIASRQ